jgi:hypothetical protein
MAKYSLNTGNTIASGSGGVSIDQTRRTFEFGDRVAELAPNQSPFFVYLSKVAKKPTSDPVFKFMEQRHQWQRRTFDVKGAVSSAAYTSGTEVANAMKVDVGYDKFGRTVSTAVKPEFLLDGQVVAIADSSGTVRNFRISQAPDLTADSSSAAQIDLVPLFSASCAFSDNAKGQVVGSAFEEGSTAPASWKDELYDREGYAQIFKTSIDLFSGTARATEYRGIPNEYQRVWQEKMMEHKMDIESSMLFGVGSADESASAGPRRYSWGILPYTEQFGKVKTFNYSGASKSTYDDFLDAMEDIYAPESGNSGSKLVLASRKVISWLNKLGDGTFLGNTVGSSQYRLDIANVPGKFGHKVTQISTIFGDLNVIQEPLLRGPYEDYAVMVDLKNVAYRPLVGNGANRDTHVVTNIQNNDVDGRQDMILTEAGLEVSLPETHAILKWS